MFQTFFISSEEVLFSSALTASWCEAVCGFGFLTLITEIEEKKQST